MSKSRFFLIIIVILSAAFLYGCADSGSEKTSNLALNRTTYASSSYDYNLTAQLATDGVTETAEPAWLTVETSKGNLPRREREWTIDGGPYSRNTLAGENDFLEYSWSRQSFSAKCLRIVGRVYFSETAGGWSVKCSAGNGSELKPIGEAGGSGLPSKEVNTQAKVNDPNKQTETIDCQSCPLYLEIPLTGADDFNRLRIEFSMPGAVAWEIFSMSLTQADHFEKSTDTGPYFSKEARGMNLMPSEVFTSAWMSADGEPQWIYVDLGEKKKFSGVNLHWIHKPMTCTIETSDDAKVWERLTTLPEDDEKAYSLKVNGKARYVRLSMQDADESGHFVLSEFEVIGKEDVNEYAAAQSDTSAMWKLCRSSIVNADGQEISTGAFNDSTWMKAVVPGTVLYSYMAAGAVPDPGIADNMLQISESYFNSDFWYRGVLRYSKQEGRRTLLTFDGINWKAEVFMNGTRLGDIAGAFIKKSFDVTDILSDVNYVAVHVIKPANYGAVKEKNSENPDFNGGMLGADNPTFHATVGWDWMPTVRGREVGIWNDVHLDAVNDVVVKNPLVMSKIAKADTLASMTFVVDLENLSDKDVSGSLQGQIEDIDFVKDVTVPAKSTITETFSYTDFPQLKDQRIALWWPVGYGNPVLHPASFKFAQSDKPESISTIEWKAGIREFTYQDEHTDLKIFINGHKMTPKGGNWGFSEFNLRFGAKEYDTALALHKEMHFNMIRNWVGQTGDDEFYDACDKYGVVVWQDFWLANPADGPDPDDNGMFLANAWDMVERIRQHPSIGLYCGRNEGYPPAALNSGLAQLVSILHPGMLYIPSSADDGVSGHGPYRMVPSEYYFDNPPKKLHSEMGVPSITTYDHLLNMLTAEHIWKPDDVWGQHDFTRTGAQGNNALMNMIRNGFGEDAFKDAETFSKYAQIVCYNGYKGMLEVNNVNRYGLLLWMSHSAWPSLSWQTYDYWFKKIGSFYGAKSGAEPLHIQFNTATMKIEVVNTGIVGKEGLTASVKLLDPTGKETYSKNATVSIHEDETLDAIDVADIPDGLCVMRLSLTDASGNEISRNLYIKNFEKGRDNGNWQGLVGTDLLEDVYKEIFEEE
jgi:hypothetical protein